MPITYFEPLSRAWARMVRVLFRPFDLMLWLGLGFSAFLSELGRGGGGGSSNVRPGRDHSMHGAADDVARRIHDVLHMGWVQAAFGVVVTAAVVFAILCLWLRARGGMVLLDGVMRGRGEVVEPWRRTSHSGNTLFLLDLLVAGAFWGLALALLAKPLAPTFDGIWNDGVFRMPDLAGMIVPLAVMGVAGLAMAIYHAWTRLFVMPVMLLRGESVFEAWRRFGGLLSSNAGHFVAATLLWIVVSVAAGFAVALFGFSTCCMGFLVLGLPYVGDVLLLPMHVFLRGFGPEFLAQFGPEWDARVLVPAGTANGAPAPPAAPPIS